MVAAEKPTILARARAKYDEYRPRAVRVEKPRVDPAGRRKLGVEDDRTVDQTGISIKGATREEIERWMGIGMRDPIAVDVIKALEKMDPAEREKILQRDPIDVLETHKRGLVDLEVKSYRLFADEKRKELARRLGWLANPNAHPFTETLKYADLIDGISPLKPLFLFQSFSELTTKVGKFVDIPKLIYFAKYSKSGSDVNLLRQATIDIARIVPEKVSPALEAEIDKSSKDSDGEIVGCNIAIEALQAAGEHGFSSLLRLYNQSDITVPVAAADKLLSIVNYRSGPIYLERRIAKALAEMITGSDNGDKLALTFFREASASGKIDGITKLTIAAHQAIGRSQDPEIQKIFGMIKEDVRANSELLGKQRDIIMLLKSFQRVILGLYLKELVQQGSFEKAEMAARELQDLITSLGEESRLRYALAYICIGLGRPTQAYDNLKVAIELDGEAVSSMFMRLDRIGEIGDEKGYLNLGRHLLTFETTRKATAAMYALGYLLVNKKSIGERWVRALIERLMAKENIEVWTHLEDKLARNQLGEFTNMLDKIVSSLKTPLVMVGNPRKIYELIDASLKEIKQTILG